MSEDPGERPGVVGLLAAMEEVQEELKEAAANKLHGRHAEKAPAIVRYVSAHLPISIHS